MEAATCAWHHMGWTPVGFSEIEPFPSAILKHRFPNVPNYGDLTKFKEWPIEPGTVDVLVGGTPCQAFSVAGLRKGLEDPRGNLALTFLALADRIKPKWILWENVPGVLTSSGGRDFHSFLSALGELGYGWSYRVLDAQFVGGSGAVPQRRRRVFVVASVRGWEAAAEVLSLRAGLQGYSASRIAKGQKSAARSAKSVRGKGGVGAGELFGSGRDGNGLSTTTGTLCATGNVFDGQDAHQDRLILGEGSSSPAAIPFRKSKKAQSETDYETWVPGETSNCLNCFDVGDTRATVAIVEPNQVSPTLTARMQGSSGWAPYNETAHILPVAFTQNQREEVRELGDTAGTLSSQPGTHQQTYIAEPVVVLDRAAYNQGANALYVPLIEESHTTPTLVARGPHAVLTPVAFSMREDASNGSFDVKEAKTAHCLQAMRPAVTSHHAQNIIVQPEAYILDSFTSNSMLSSNPNSGCRQADISKCLDTACLNPTANQGGVAIVQKLYENHPNDSRVTGPHDIAPTVVSRYGTGGGNVPLINTEKDGTDTH